MRQVGLYNKLDTVKLIVDSAATLLNTYSSSSDARIADVDCIKAINAAVLKSYEFLYELLDTDFEGYDQEETD